MNKKESKGSTPTELTDSLQNNLKLGDEMS